MLKIFEECNCPEINFYEVHGVSKFETFYVAMIKGRLIMIRPTNLDYDLTIHYWYDVTRVRKHLNEQQVIEIIQNEYLNSLL